MADGVEVRVIVDALGSRPYGKPRECSRASPRREEIVVSPISGSTGTASPPTAGT